MKRIILFCFCSLSIFIQAQTSGGIQKELEDMLSGMQMEMDLFKEQIHKDFSDFVIEQDRAFTEMLQQQWEDFQLFSGKIPESKKPPVAPSADNSKVPSSSIHLQGKLIESGPTPTQNIPPRIPKQADSPENLDTYTLSFYGTPVFISYDRKTLPVYRGELNEKGIAAYWEQLAAIPYDVTLNSLFAEQERLGLTDWGFYSMTLAFAKSIYPSSESSARLLSWFLLNKGGYKAQLGINGKQVILLMPFIQGVYEIPYVEKGGTRYYAMQPVEGNLRTYTGEFAEGNIPLDLQITKAPSFAGSSIKERVVSFTYSRNSYEFPLHYNQGLIDYYNDYPLTDMVVYFDASLSSELKEDLFLHFSPILSQLDKPEDKVQLILDFIYQSLPYMTDDDQFGGERYFFAEETIAYPYSDCEDRAVLFSHMVETLLDYPTIGLLYPNHVSAAVHLKEYNGDGYKYLHNNKEYISCDPTYINSLVGMAMSAYMDYTAEVIPVSFSDYELSQEDLLWEKLIANCKFPGGGKNQTIPTAGNKYFICGYENTNNSIRPFIGKVDMQGTFDWILPLQSENDIYRPTLFYANNTLYFSGQYSAPLSFSDKQITPQSSTNLFLAAVSQLGQVEWLKGYAPETANEHTAYLYNLKTDGTIEEELWFPETGEMESTTLLLTNQTIKWSGVLAQSEHIAMNRANVTHSTEAVAVPDLLYTINNRLVKDEADPGIAGVFAFIELLTKPGQTVEGRDVVAALDKYNPSFKQRCPNIYKNIAAISMVVNESGVITVKTANGKPVSFDKVRIQSGSKVNLRILPNKDAKLEVIDGVKVGAAIVWFKLNHVILYRNSGDLLFDYDKNHTTKNFNLTKDILN